MTRARTAATFRILMATKSSKSTPAPAGRPTLSFSRANAIWLGAGAVSIAIGFFLLAKGSETIAPVLLVLGYCVLLPIGIIKK